MVLKEAILTVSTLEAILTVSTLGEFGSLEGTDLQQF